MKGVKVEKLKSTKMNISMSLVPLQPLQPLAPCVIALVRTAMATNGAFQSPDGPGYLSSDAG